MELIDLIPNAMSFRVITTIDIEDEAEIPVDFTGRVRRHAGGSVSYVAWYRDGQLHNPGRQYPAYRRFRPDGQVKMELYLALPLCRSASIWSRPWPRVSAAL